VNFGDDLKHICGQEKADRYGPSGDAHPLMLMPRAGWQFQSGAIDLKTDKENC
jgi:hypothetical protein